MDKPISVIMSVYNERIDELDAAIRSVLTQTFQDFEFIIVDDAPQREDMIEYLSKIKAEDNRIVLVFNECNIGLARSMNRAAEEAKGEYLARMDADDICHEKRLERQLECMHKTDVDMTCTWFAFIGPDGTQLTRTPKRYHGQEIKEKLPYQNTICHPTVMIRKEVFKKIGGYRNFPCSQDYDLWLRLFELGTTVSVVEEVLYYYRVREGAISQRNRVKQSETMWYIQHLYRMRATHGKDMYSEEAYEQWLEKNHAYDKKYCEKEQAGRKIEDKIEEYRSSGGHPIKCVALIIYLAAKSPFYRKLILHSLQKRIKFIRDVV